MYHRASQIDIQTYSLPFSTLIPSLNLILALGFLAWTLFGGTKQLSFHGQPQLFFGVLLSYTALVLPVILATLSAPYVFSGDVRACLSELQWKRWYIGKDEGSVRSVQNALRCCGFNSMPDRAWPFPSRDHDAGTCQRTSGFRGSCAPLWQVQLQLVAILCMSASILVHFSVVSQFFSL